MAPTTKSSCGALCRSLTTRAWPGIEHEEQVAIGQVAPYQCQAFELRRLLIVSLWCDVYSYVLRPTHRRALGLKVSGFEENGLP